MSRTGFHKSFVLALTVLLGICPALPAGAQNGTTLYGQVLSESGEALPYAHIQLISAAPGSNPGGGIADSSGYFKLKVPPQGSIALRLSAVGYEPLKTQIQLPAAADTLSFALKPIAALQTLVVSASLRERYLSASPVRIDVLPAAAIQTYLPGASSTLMESISLVSGLEEVQACGVCMTNSISINGLPGAYTAVMIDGMPLFGALASTYGLNGIPVQIIERVEIIKGPGSTLFGSEAVGGVINVITKDPAAQPALSLDMMGTQHAEFYGNLAFAHRIGKSRGFSALSSAYSDHFEDRNSDGFSDVVHLDRYTLFQKWDLFRPSARRWTLAGRLYYEDRRNGVEAFLKDRAYRQLRGSDQIYGESISTFRAEVFGNYELNTQTPLSLDYGWSSHAQQSWYGDVFYRAQQRNGLINGRWEQSYGQHRLLGGIALRYQYYDDNTSATQHEHPADSLRVLNQPDQGWIPGVFVQDEWEPHRNWTLLGGLRLDHWARHGLIPSPRLSIKWQPHPMSAFRLNSGTGFRVVNLFAEEHAFVSGQRQVIIAEDLSPERSWNISLSASRQLFLFGGNGSFEADIYYTNFSNQILADYSQVGFIRYSNASGWSRSTGLSALLQQRFAFPLALQISGNVQRVQLREQDESGQWSLRDMEHAARWTALFSADYTWRKADLSIAYMLRGIGPMALPAVFDLDAEGQPLAHPRPLKSQAYVIHQIQLIKRFGESWSVYGGVQNLGNYQQEGSPLAGLNDPAAAAGFSEWFDTNYVYAPMHSREAYLGVRYTLSRKSE